MCDYRISLNSIIEALNMPISGNQFVNLEDRYAQQAERCGCSVGELAAYIMKRKADFLIPTAIKQKAMEWEKKQSEGEPGVLTFLDEPEYVTEYRSVTENRAHALKTLAQRLGKGSFSLAEELESYGIELPPMYARENRERLKANQRHGHQTARAKRNSDASTNEEKPIPGAEISDAPVDSPFSSTELREILPAESMEVTVGGKHVIGIRIITEYIGLNKKTVVELITED